MDYIGRFHFKRQMRSLAVVDGDGLFHHRSGLFQILGPVQQQLTFQDAVDPLCQCVLLAIVAIGHRAGQALFLVDALVVV